jgi:Electron transfer DM13
MIWTQSGKTHLSFGLKLSNMDRLKIGITLTSLVFLLTIFYAVFTSIEISGSAVVEIFAFTQIIPDETFEGNVVQTVSNNLSASTSNDSSAVDGKPMTGTFQGAGDGIHNAEGMAKVITLQDGNRVLRLENLKATNGPDLYVYLATDKGASDFVDLGRLKGNIGNQNYNIPQGTDLTKYNIALIWCKQFSVLFGSAKLVSQ